MKSRKSATKHSVAHSNQRSAVHGIDVRKNKELRMQRNENQKESREFVPKDEEPVFRSDVSGLGGGKCFQILEGRLVEMDSKEWEDALWQKVLELSWYHQPQTRKLKTGTVTELKRRKIKDRMKLGLRDKHARPQTDVMRETIDLRPDHTRMLQYLLEAGRGAEARTVVDEAREVKIRLFEKVYPGRYVLFPSEHDDAGQHHDDLWHSGITEDPDEIIKGRENGKRVMRPRRDRAPFRNYGIGVGAASWSRHFGALRDAGFIEAQMEEFAAPTMDAVKEDTQQVRERYECRPRDARLLAVLDRLVHRKLREIAPEIVEKANGEYAAFLVENYQAGKIGVKASKRMRIRALEQELAKERQRSETLAKAANDAQKAAGELEKEVFAALDHLQPTGGESIENAAKRIVSERDEAQEQHKRLWEQITTFLALLFSEKMISAVKQWPFEILKALGKLAHMVGRDYDFSQTENLTPTVDSGSSSDRDAQSSRLF